MGKLNVKVLFLTLMLLCLYATNVFAGETLLQVKKQGYVNCGVSTGILGFSLQVKNKKWTGFDVSLCRAVAVAVFNDVNKVRFTPLNTKERFTSLHDNKVDLLIRNSTLTARREVLYNLQAVAISFFDKQSFLLYKSSGIVSNLQLNGETICIQSATTSKENLDNFFKKNHMKYKALLFDNTKAMIQAFAKKRCEVLTSDTSQLYAIKHALQTADNLSILQGDIASDPFAIYVRNKDTQWANIVRWTFYLLLNAEAKQVTSDNIDTIKKSKTGEGKLFLMQTQTLAKHLDLDPDWAYNVIKKVGNYSQIFERTLGKYSVLKLDRGANALVQKGGLMYPLPF